MAYAPDGRLLSPGEVWEAPSQERPEEQWSEDLNELLICPDCDERPPNLVEEFSAGDTVCASCGRVLSQRGIDTRSEWRTFSNDDAGNDDPSRIGDAANPMLHGSQLSTEISFGDGGQRVRELSRAHNKSNHDKANKSLQAAFSQIATMCDSQNISKPTADAAKLIFRKADDAKIFKGKGQDAVIAGCIFIACRQNNQQRSFKEIYNMTNVSKKDVGRTFKVLESFLQREQKETGAKTSGNGALDPATFQAGGTTSAENLMPRACAKLNLEPFVSLVAEECARVVTEQGVAAGRSPLSIAGACLYLVSHLMGHPRTPKEIGAAVEVSDGTIRTAYKLMWAERTKIVQESWIRRGGDASRIPAA
jgi:transcription initiation factor TFIIB